MALSTANLADRQAILDALGNKCLVFVGMMGSGKTAIGRLVAQSLSLPYFDSDHEIVAAANLEIPEIFERHGEDYFRAGEERVIHRLLSDGPSVYFTGRRRFHVRNNTPGDQEARHIDMADCRSRSFDAKSHEAPGYQAASANSLIQGPPLPNCMTKREPVYALADLHVPSSKVSKNHTRDAVLTALSENYLIGTDPT